MATAAKESKSTEVATTIGTPNALRALMKADTTKNFIVPMLIGAGLRAEDYGRVMGEVTLVAADNPAILKCAPASVIRAVAKAVGWGLTIGETVHLVPFGDKLTAIQDYKGKIELIVRAAGAKSIDAQVVYEKEFFEYESGTNPYIRHKPARNTGDRGALIGAYAVAQHGANRPPTIKWMTIADVDAIRRKYSKQWKNDACPPWYAMKTAVHQLAKLLPKNPRMASVMKALEEEELEESLPEGGPVAVQDPAPAAAATATLERDESCICDAETGEADSNCPIHGDYTEER